MISMIAPAVQDPPPQHNQPKRNLIASLANDNQISLIRIDIINLDDYTRQDIQRYIPNFLFLRRKQTLGYQLVVVHTWYVTQQQTYVLSIIDLCFQLIVFPKFCLFDTQLIILMMILHGILYGKLSRNPSKIILVPKQGKISLCYRALILLYISYEIIYTHYNLRPH